MFDARRSYAIHWELTDLCNLKCPMCPRTNHLDRCRPMDFIQGHQFFLEDAKQYLPGRFLRQVRAVDFCGNFGDPCLARDFYGICSLLSRQYAIALTVSTNGSMRHPDWWQKLGELFAAAQVPGRVEFHIDGLEETNHVYRIGANWPKIMANTRAFIEAGGRADWLYIVFKHNQHQVTQAREVARHMGFQRFVTIITGRFPNEQGPNEQRFAYMHPQGDMRYLEPPAETIGDRNDCRAGREETTPVSGIGGIKCKSAKHNRIYLDSAGYMSPCCWVAGVDDQKPGNMLKAVRAAGRDPEDFNIRRRSIIDIVQDPLFSDVFSELWKADQLETCRKKCGRGHRNIRSGIRLQHPPSD